MNKKKRGALYELGECCETVNPFNKITWQDDKAFLKHIIKKLASNSGPLYRSSPLPPGFLFPV